ncbi:MAG: GGDEF domain-containing protein [Mycobacterium leprae]
MLSRLSLKFKLTTLVVLLVAIGSVSFAQYVGRGLQQTLTQAAGSGVLLATEVLADSISPSWLGAVEPKTDRSTDYLRLEREFKKLTDNGRVARAELIRFPSADTVESVLSVPADSSSDYVSPGTRSPLSAQYWYSQQAPGYHMWVIDRPGTYVIGWVPIMDGSQRVGMVAVISDASAIKSTGTAVNIGLIVLIALLPVLAGTVTYMFSASFERIAVTDGLMGIYNHKFFKQRLEQEVARSRRYGHQTSIVLLDIDFFKRVNDTYGHTTGDIVLKNLAKWIKDSCRNTDVICRYGGEEIVIILTHTGMAGAQEFAERLRLKISQQVVRDPGENAEFRITVSVGVSQWERGLDYMTLIKRADAALYHSKHTGRNRVTIYTEDLPLEPEKQAKAT